MRRAAKSLGIVLGVLVLCAVAAILLLPRIELGPFVAARASAALGRTIEIASLRITPGRTVGIALRGLRIANIPTGSEPDMLRLARVDAVLDGPALLRGRVVVRQSDGEGLYLLLERDARRVRNWRLGAGARPASQAPAVPPPVHAARLANAEIVFRTSSGKRLVTRLHEARLAAPDPEKATLVEATGSYNDAPLVARIDLGPIGLLREGRPTPARVRGQSGDTTLDFHGTARDPLNVDGLEGRLSLRAPTPGPILQMAQAELPIALDIALSGHAVRDHALWRVNAIEGSLFDAPFTGRLLEMREGAEGEPDAIAADLDFSRLDINRILAGPRDQGGDDDADVPLVVLARPDPRLDLRLAARELAYARLNATDVSVVATQQPGRVAVEDLRMTAFGARFQASGALHAAETGARVEAAAALLEGQLEALRRAFGTRALPLAGPMQARMVIESQGETVNQAFRAAKVGAVVTMQGGTIAREVIEMASTDIRALFRTARGSTQLRCLLAVIAMKDRRGQAAPLRIRAATGTIVGTGSFDLNRRTLELVIGTQRSTTATLALDIPVRVYGSFADPDIGLADWSPASRQRLAAGDTLPDLPPALVGFARANPCYQPPPRRR